MAKRKGLGSALDSLDLDNQSVPPQSARIFQFDDLLKAQVDAAVTSKLTNEDSSAIDELQKNLEAVGGKYKVELRLIDPDPHQPRKTFPKVVVEERAESLRRNGQLSPIILIPQENGRHLLFEGELRYRAATLLKWNELDAVFLPMEAYQPVDPERFKKQMLTSAHAQRLHDLDLAEGILHLVEQQYPEWAGRGNELPRVLNTVFARLKRAGQLDELNAVRNAAIEVQQDWIKANLKEHERPLFQVILEMQYSPNSVLKSAFPLLSLPDDLKELVRSTGLESSKVKELQKLNAKNLGTDEDEALEIRSQVAQEVVEGDLSLSEIKAKVTQTIQQYTTVAVSQVSPTVKKIRSIAVAGVERSELQSVKEALLEKVREIDSQLTSEE